MLAICLEMEYWLLSAYKDKFMKLVERVKAERTVEKIQGGTFDQDDIELLLIRLRAYSGGYWVFREASNFVAHNDVRDQGVINESLDTFNLSVRFFMEYGYTGVGLRLDEPFPAYIKKLLTLQVKKFDEKELLKETGLGRAKLLVKIDNHIKKAAKGQCVLEVKKAGEKVYNAFAYLLQRIKVAPVFSPEDLYGEVIGVLSANKVAHNQDALFEQKDRFILSFALMLHQTQQQLTDGKVGNCELDFEELGGVRHLVVKAGVQVDFENAHVEMVHTIFNTGLSVVEYCGASILSEDASAIRSNLARPIQLIDGKLEVINAPD